MTAASIAKELREKADVAGGTVRVNSDNLFALIEAFEAMGEALDPDTLDAVADEIGTEFKHSARADSLRGIAKRQRVALAKAGV